MQPLSGIRPTTTSTPSATASSRGSARRSPPPRKSPPMGEVIDENKLGRTSATSTRSCRREWSGKDNLWTIEAVRTDTNEDLASPPFPLDVPGLLPPSEATRPNGRACRTSRAASSIPQTRARGSRLQGQNVLVIGPARRRRRSFRAMADDCVPCHAAQRSLILHPWPQRERSRQYAARQRNRQDVDLRDRPAQGAVRSGGVHPPLVREPKPLAGTARWREMFLPKRS